MVGLSIEDQITLLVGRVILAFGELDQTIQMGFDAMNAMPGGAETATESMDRRFAHRVKQYRRLVVKLTGEKSDSCRAFDKICGKAGPAIHIRQRLAHSTTFIRNGTLEVIDRAGLEEWVKVAQRADRTDNAKSSFDAWSKHVKSSYTPSELEEAASTLSDARTSLSVLLGSVVKASLPPKTRRVRE